jgi:hypothetical protein
MRSVFNIVMRIFSTLLGLVLIFFGSVFTMQGLHIGPSQIMHGFMVGNGQWIAYGAVILLLGVGQVIWTNTRRA